MITYEPDGRNKQKKDSRSVIDYAGTTSQLLHLGKGRGVSAERKPQEKAQPAVGANARLAEGEGKVCERAQRIE